MKIVSFQNSFAFVFSPRPGTAAVTLEDPVSAEEKMERLYELIALQEALTSQALKSWVGKEVEVLVEGPTQADKSCMQGRSSQNITVNLAAPISGLKAGHLVKAKVVHASRFSVRAEYLPAVGALSTSISTPARQAAPAP